MSRRRTSITLGYIDICFKQTEQAERLKCNKNKSQSDLKDDIDRMHKDLVDIFCRFRNVAAHVANLFLVGALWGREVVEVDGSYQLKE